MQLSATLVFLRISLIESDLGGIAQLVERFVRNDLGPFLVEFD